LGSWLSIHFASDYVALFLIHKDFANLEREKLFLGGIAKHTDESRVDLEDLVVRSDDVDAFLEGFEELGETCLAAALRCNIAGETGEAMNLVVAHHGVGDALEMMDTPGFFQTDLKRAGPEATLHEALDVAHELFFGDTGFVGKELSNGKADDLLERQADEI